MSELGDGLITEEALEEFRSRIGAKFRVRQFNELASKDAIRKFADGIGDPNPLWRDEEYVEKTRYGCISAPPAWLYSVFPTWVLQGLPGVHAFHSGNDWEFYRPVFVNDKIKGECVFTGFEEKASKFAGKLVMEYQEARYRNQRDKLVAKAKVWIVRTERHAARKIGKYQKIQLPHPWTEEELTKIEDEALNEQIQGSKVRYWEDVQVGDEVPPVIKGPLGVTDIIAWCVGAAPVPILAHGLSLRLYRKHPAWGFRDPNTFAMEPIYGVHYNMSAAKAAGLPFPYDVGVQRQSWLIHMFTNWMGDEGWLKRCYAEYRRFIYLSDVVWVRGKIIKKYIDEEGEHCVDIETNAINQRGENTMPGRGTVILPSREAGTWPLEKRLP
ncbi:MAG: acyl dehydratase [Nitrososphaeria archaeon]|nr:acyl dehydratase [Nitrososphaeria archaeon]NIQ33190.1 acyl dehydratase [Nitrososphaeria archaeon]